MSNIAFVESLYAAFGRGDVSFIMANVAPNVVWDMTGRPEDYPRFGKREGPAGVGAFFQMLVDNEEFTEFQVTEMREAGDKVYVLGHLSARMKKNGKSLTTDWIHIFTVKDGKVAAFKEFLDTAQFVAASK
ncbi:MAG: nuclear transport factor 2 family protein [Terricaulis silvestris]